MHFYLAQQLTCLVFSYYFYFYGILYDYYDEKLFVVSQIAFFFFFA